MNEVKIRAGFVGFGEVNTPREFIVDRCRRAAEELRSRGIVAHGSRFHELHPPFAEFVGGGLAAADDDFPRSVHFSESDESGTDLYFIHNPPPNVGNSKSLSLR